MIYLHFLISHSFLMCSESSFCPKLWKFFLQSHKRLSSCQINFPILNVNPPVLVTSGCFNKISLTGWTKKQTFICHSSRGWEAYQDASMIRFWWKPSSWFADGCLLTVSSYGRERGREREPVRAWALALVFLLYKDTNPIMGTLPSWPNYLLKAHHIGIRISANEFWGDTSMQSITPP